MEKILQIQNIHKNFASNFTGYKGEQEIEYAEILSGVSFDVAKGTVMALIGTNGSGKSTLFNIISGLLKPNKGEVNYVYEGNTYNLSEISEYQHARIGIARLFQGSNIFPNMSVLDNMLVADNNRFGEQPWHLFHKLTKIENHRIEEAEHILTNYLTDDNSLWKKRNEFAGNLSIGQQRLLAFSRLFMNEKAELYLLDEPCAGVNPIIRETMANMIKKLKSERKTVLLIEHNLDFVQTTCSEAVYVEVGRVAYKGKIQETLAQKSIIENYIGNKFQS
jgi:branched-chain amino acid transport system ATP-binding protein